MATIPTSLPPSPLPDFLQVAIPDLDAMAPGHPLWGLQRDERERDLYYGSDKNGPDWLIQSAAFRRDTGQFRLAVEDLERALDRAMATGDNRRSAAALGVYASILHIEGYHARARQRVAQISLFARGDCEAPTRGLFEESAGRFSGLSPDEEEVHLRRAMEIYRAENDLSGQIRVNCGLASVASTKGNYLVALDYTDAGLKLCAQHQHWRWIPRLLLAAAIAFRDQGYRQKVEGLFNLAKRWSDFLGDVPTALRCQIGLGYLLSFQVDSRNLTETNRPIDVLTAAAQESMNLGAFSLQAEALFCLSFTYNKLGDQDRFRRCRQESEELESRIGERIMKPMEDVTAAFAEDRNSRFARRLRDSMEGTLDPFFIYDALRLPNGQCTDLINEYRNAAANGILGCERSDVRTLRNDTESPYFERLLEPLLRVVNDRLPFEDEIQVINARGETVWYLRRAVAAADGVALTFRDVTESRKVEEALRSAAERAQQADHAKGFFLANMSHEIRTPIHGVLGLARLLAKTDLTTTQKSYVESIISSGDILLGVIGDILDLTKIESHTMQLDPRPVPIPRLVRDTVQLFSGQALERGLTLTHDIMPNVPDVAMLDAARLRQILANLIGNALKFTRVGSVHLRASIVDTSLQFEVIDTGIGIPADRQVQIFRAFQQANTGPLAESGTGLGLTISKRLVELMGGDIAVTSSEGQGSRFHFRIPMRAVDPESTFDMAALTEGAVRFDSRKALLVEDNAINILLAKSLLEELGFSVVIAENGAVALETLDRTFDIVVMDVRMPVMNGLQATRQIRLREAGTGQHIPIVAITAGAFADERDECFNAGMDDYLGKPFTIDSLRATLARWVPASRNSSRA